MLGKRDSAVRASLGLFQKADCDRWAIALRVVDLLVFEFAGEHCEGSDTSAVTLSNCLEDGLQDLLFGSTNTPR